MDGTKLGKILRVYRTNSNMTQKELASEVRADRSLIRDIENFRPIDEEHRNKIEFIFDYASIGYTKKDINEVIAGIEKSSETKEEQKVLDASSPSDGNGNSEPVENMKFMSVEDHFDAHRYGYGHLSKVRQFKDLLQGKNSDNNSIIEQEIKDLRLKESIIDSLIDCCDSEKDGEFNRGIITSMRVIKQAFAK